MKDTPADRKGPRERLAESLDAIFRKKIDRKLNVDSVEPKLFGIGAESYTPGSHEFYLGYAVSRQMLLTLDAGHYHPTEGIADKISSVLCFLPEIALHVSRGVRWDSDHVVTLTDELQAIAQEIVWGGYREPRAHRPGLLRRQHQPRRRLGHRHAQHAQGAAAGPAGAHRQAEGGWKPRAITRRAWRCMEDAKLLPAGAVWD